jgi:ribosomal protein S18 acetylase RimI-like enzyme
VRLPPKAVGRTLPAGPRGPHRPRILDRVLRTVRDPVQLAEVAGHEALSRASLINSEFTIGWTDAGATVWVGHRDSVEGDGHRVIGSGPSEGVARILDRLAGELPVEASFSLPAGSADGLGRHHTVLRRDDWELRWLTTAPPRLDLESRVVTLPGDSAEVAELGDEAYPTAEARPGDPAVRSWAAVRDGSGRLVAAAADTSSPHTGRISAVMTAPAARGHGWGAAVTTALSRRMLEEFDLVVLGLYIDNDRARRLYDRNGFHGRLIVTSGGWAAPAPLSSMSSSSEGHE